VTVPTPLEAEIRRQIARNGPITVAHYMDLCLGHPEHGYYTTRDPLGRAGDFTTAPEISQMFGELIGLWAVAVWQQMGSPDGLRLVELGPGRGTLMADALRASKVVPGFCQAATVHLVEISEVLRQRQQDALREADVPVLWHDDLQNVPYGPSIILANEFFDALPVHQAVRQDDGWYERVVEIDGVDKLVFGIGRAPIAHFDGVLPRHLRQASVGAIYEWRTDSAVLEVGRRVAHGGAALIVDYGHVESALGDTFQAVRSHAFANPLIAPGQADITAHVDFQALATTAESVGAKALGPLQQAQFLRRIGIEHRAAVLKSQATREVAAEIDAARERLTARGPKGMGQLFKVLGLAHPALVTLPGFEA
jgi:NADH dehydrogenase [ubiquinone] 1 alpha subcomplex assembly factor 7